MALPWWSLITHRHSKVLLPACMPSGAQGVVPTSGHYGHNSNWSPNPPFIRYYYFKNQIWLLVGTPSMWGPGDWVHFIPLFRHPCRCATVVWWGSWTWPITRSMWGREWPVTWTPCWTWEWPASGWTPASTCGRRTWRPSTAGCTTSTPSGFQKDPDLSSTKRYVVYYSCFILKIWYGHTVNIVDRICSSTMKCVNVFLLSMLIRCDIISHVKKSYDVQQYQNYFCFYCSITAQYISISAVDVFFTTTTAKRLHFNAICNILDMKPLQSIREKLQCCVLCRPIGGWLKEDKLKFCTTVLHKNWSIQSLCLKRHKPTVVIQVIDLGGEPITAREYSGLGRVTEFKYGAKLGSVIRRWNGDKLADLK